MNGRQSLAILCPVHNEEATAPLFWGRIRPVIERLGGKYDVRLVFLNNASTDGTLHAIQSIAVEFRRTYVVTMSRNVGYQASIECGLKRIEADFYVIIDVDCEDPPELIEVFARRCEAGNDIVYGERLDRPEPAAVKGARSLFYRILQRVADDDILLHMAEFALFSRVVRDCVITENTSFPFIRASIARAGFRREAVPYCREHRIAGTSHYNVVRMTVFAVAGILASSTLLLRMPIYLLPFWAMLLTGLCVGWGLTGAPGLAAASFLTLSLYVGASVAFIALYVARTYKNGLMRPNATIDWRLSRLPDDGQSDAPS